VESICTDTVVILDVTPAENKLVRTRLQEIARREAVKWHLGLIECAETIRLFAIRGFTEESYATAIKAVGMVHTITQVDYRTVAMVIADTLRMLHVEDTAEFEKTTDYLLELIRRSHVLPQEFFQAFLLSRGAVSLHGLETSHFFDLLAEYLDAGVTPDNMFEVMCDS